MVGQFNTDGKHEVATEESNGQVEVDKVVDSCKQLLTAEKHIENNWYGISVSCMVGGIDTDPKVMKKMMVRNRQAREMASPI